MKRNGFLEVFLNLVLVVGAFMASAGATILSRVDKSESKDGDQHSGQQLQPTGNQPVKQTPDQLFAERCNKFGVSLLSQVGNGNGDQNVIVSPVSVSLALSHLLVGSHGQTMVEIADLLGGWDPKELQQAREAAAAFLGAMIETDPKIELQVATAFFTHKGLGLEPDYLKAVQKEFRTLIKELDFKGDSAGSLAKINEWNKHRQRIQNGGDFGFGFYETGVGVVTSIYFKGAWQVPFDPKQTSEREFTTSEGKKLTTASMRKTGSIPYFETSEFQAVSLPYGKEGRISMRVYLPRNGRTVSNVLKRLDAQTLATHSAKFAFAQGQLFMPKFKVSYEKQLNQTVDCESRP